MSLELVTAHTGTAHITAEQVASLIKGAISDDTDNLYRFQTGNQCAYSITDALQIQINTGDAVLSGRHFQITEAEVFDIDPSTLNYSRIDGVFFEIYSDNDTSEELCRFVTVQGSEYLTFGGTASLPATPDSVDDTHTLMYVFPWLYVYVSYETITEVVDGTSEYPNVLDLDSRITTEEATTETINATIETMQETFQAGVDAVYNACVAIGLTPASSTPTAIAAAIATAGSGTATADKILSGYTAYASSNLLTGTMTNRGAYTATGTPSGNNSTNVTIPAGYHNGSGYIKCNGSTSYSAGYSSGYNSGYSSGRSQGRADGSNYSLINTGIVAGSTSLSVTNNYYYALAINTVSYSSGATFSVSGATAIGYNAFSNNSGYGWLVYLKATSTTMTIKVSNAGNSMYVLARLGPAS